MSEVVALREVRKDYPLGKTVVSALRGINFQVDEGEFTAIAGPSGSGKTTLLNLVGCVDIATAGVVRVAGIDTAAQNDRRLTELRLRTLGFIFQSFNLVQVLTLEQNVEFPLLLQGGIDANERKKRVREMVDRVGLAKQMGQRPTELSGGQRQRVAIARALVTRPKIVLADEPTANLDSGTGKEILDLMNQLNREEKTTFIFSTHDTHVMAHARRIIHLADGKIVSDAPANGAIPQ